MGAAPSTRGRWPLRYVARLLVCCLACAALTRGGRRAQAQLHELTEALAALRAKADALSLALFLNTPLQDVSPDTYLANDAGGTAGRSSGGAGEEGEPDARARTVSSASRSKRGAVTAQPLVTLPAASP